MVHMHITAWALGLILFFVAYSLYSAGRKGKGVHMGLRLMYIIIIVTGFMLYMSIVKTATGSMHMWYGLKKLLLSYNEWLEELPDSVFTLLTESLQSLHYSLYDCMYCHNYLS
ncbi:DUF1516 family protein, partial [Bacillus sp. HC-Mk]